MVGEIISLEEALPGGSPLVPADRTSPGAKRNGRPAKVDFSNVKSGKFGELPSDPKMREILASAAKKHGVPEKYAYALAQQESAYNPDAYNGEYAAAGLFQYIPGTARQRGINALDPVQSADAAMGDFATRMKVGGVEEAIMSHFAGPGGSGRGKKTKQYLADVSKRAEDIAIALGASPDEAAQAGKDAKADFSNVNQGIATGNLKTPKPGDVISLDDALPPTPDQIEGKTELKDEATGSWVEDNLVKPLANAGQGAFDTVMSRIKESFPGLRSEDEVEDAAFGIGVTGRVKETLENGVETESPISMEDSGDRELRWRKEISNDPAKIAQLPKDLQHLAPDKNLKGYIDNLENPLKLMTQDSMPADFLQYYSNLPEIKRKQFDQARKVSQQQHIVDNPDQFPAVSVAAARQAIAAREAKQTPQMRQMWNALKAAAVEDPGKFGAVLTNALVADPEMVFAPMGLGTKVLRGTATAAGVGTSGTVGKILKVADRVIDAGSVGAALNVGMEAIDSAAAGKVASGKDLAFAGLTGAALAGPLGAFFRTGASARAAIKGGNLSEEALDAAKRAVAQDEIVAENIIKAPQSEVLYTPDGRAIPADARARIENELGIQNMSPSERTKYLNERRKEWRAQFTEHWEEGDYQSYKAQERIDFAQARAAEAEEAAKQAALANARVSVTKTRSEVAEMARTQRAANDFDAALAARDQAELNGQFDEATAIDKDLDAIRRMDEADAIDSAFTNDVPAIKRALNRAAQKDSKIARPKGQRGDVDPELAARLALVGVGTAAGVAMAPDEGKMAGGFLGGLAGLLIPGGGRSSVLRRMRQSGAVNADGNIGGLMLKADKLAGEADFITKAKQGNPVAQKKLFDEYFPRLTRAARSYVREAGPKLGIEAEDVAIVAMTKAFQNLDKFEGGSEFYTWLHSIMKNEGLNTIRAAQSRLDTTSMHPGEAGERGSARAGGIAEGGEQGLVRGDVESAAATIDTPENAARAAEVEQQLENAINKLPKSQSDVLKMRELENYTDTEIAEKLGINEALVRVRASNARKAVEETLMKDLGIKRPRSQAGEIDPRLMGALALAGMGAAAGAYLSPDELDDEGNVIKGRAGTKNRAMLAGALFAAGLMVRGRKGTSVGGAIGEAAEHTLGVASTTLLNISPKLHRRANEHFRKVLQIAHQHNEKVSPFLTALKKQSQGDQRLIKRAILTGDTGVINRILDATGNVELINGYKGVRSSLDSLKDQLVTLKRFKPGATEYFPRVVTDLPGLLTHVRKKMGTEATDYLSKIIQDAEADAIRKRGSGLSDIERSVIINNALQSEPKLGGQPGFAKNRMVKEVTEGMEGFYADPAESLHTYIRDAVTDIEKSKFFGKDLAVKVKDGQEFTNLQDSVGTMVERMMQRNELTPEAGKKLSTAMEALFIGGDRSPNWLIQGAKNLNYAGLLGNVFGAASQLGDPILQTYIHGLRPALDATVRKLTGRKYVSMKEFGLVDHIAEEFVSNTATAKYVQKAFKYSLFTGVDSFGKDVALNSSVSAGLRLAKSKEGIEKLRAKYGASLTEDEFTQLVKDFKAGELTDLVHSVAWADLTRTQPVSKMEMPVAYLNNPNGRMLYQYKSFMLKQIDVVRRDAYNEIKKGNYVKGMKSLVTFGAILGISGMPASMIKDWVSGKDVELELTDIPLNAAKTFGMSEYVVDHMFGVDASTAKAKREAGDKSARQVKAEPIGTAVGMALPAYKQFEEIVRGDPKALMYIPGIGRVLYERRKNAEAKAEAEND